MLVDSISLSDFRGVDATQTVVELSENITAVVGPSTAGKKHW